MFFLPEPFEMEVGTGSPLSGKDRTKDGAPQVTEGCRESEQWEVMGGANTLVFQPGISYYHVLSFLLTPSIIPGRG